MITHFRIANAVIKEYGIFDRFDRAMFCVGSVIPDLLISQFYRRHFYSSSGEYMLDYFDSLSDSTSAFTIFKYGIAAHYFTDYCCAVHSGGRIGDPLKHAAYERKLEKSLRDSISELTAEICLYPYHGEIRPLLERYRSSEVFSVDRDLRFALAAVCKVCSAARRWKMKHLKKLR